MACGYSPYTSISEENYASDILMANSIEFIKGDTPLTYSATAFLCHILSDMTLENIKALNTIPGDCGPLSPLDWYKLHMRNDFLRILGELPWSAIEAYKVFSDTLKSNGHRRFYTEFERIFNLQDLHSNAQDAKPERSSDS